MILTRRDGAAQAAQEAAKGAKTPRVVADVTMEPGKYAGDLRVKGEVVVPQEILLPALDRIAGQLENTKNPKVEFDAKTGNFVVSGTYTGLPLWHPTFKLELEPVMEGGKFGLKVAKLEHPGPHWIVDNYFLKKTARCTTDKGYPSEFDKKAKTFWVNADAVVHSWTKLSPWLHLDFSQTPLNVKTDGNGGVVFDMDGPPTDKPHENKARIRLDAYSISAIFNEAFGEHFQIRDIEMSEGRFRLNGRARSDLVDGIKGLFALFALAAGGNPDMGEPGIKAHVDIEQKGDNFLIRPGIGGQKAANQIAEALRSRNLPAQARDGYVELPSAELFKKYNLQSLKLTPAGLLVEASTEPAAIATPPRH